MDRPPPGAGARPAPRLTPSGDPSPASVRHASGVARRRRYERWRATCDTLHAHTQVLGKLAVALAPPEPQLQHAALRLTARGWETPLLPAPDGSGALVVALDLRTHEAVVEHTGGGSVRVPLTPHRSVGEVARDVAGGGRPARRCGADQPDTAGGAVDRPARRGRRARDLRPGAGRRLLRRGDPGGAGARPVPRALPRPIDAGARLVGRVRPGRHPVLRRPGRTAVAPTSSSATRPTPRRSSVGWWPGDARHPTAAFYAYAHPAPEGFPRADLSPGRWDDVLGEYLLEEEDIRAAPDPEARGPGLRPPGVPPRVRRLRLGRRAGGERRGPATAGQLTETGICVHETHDRRGDRHRPVVLTRCVLRPH